MRCECFHSLAKAIPRLWDRVLRCAAPGWTGAARRVAGDAAVLGFHMGAKVHPSAIPPAEEGLSLVDLPGDEFLGGGHGFIVDRFHPLPRERPGVLNGLATVAIRLGPKHTRGPNFFKNSGSFG